MFKKTYVLSGVVMVAIIVVAAIGYYYYMYLPSVSEKPPAELLIGFINPLSGWAKAQGDYALEGANMAVENINKEGGIWVADENRHYTIKLLLGDEEASAEKGALVARKLILEDKVWGLVGVFSSATVMTVIEVVADNKVPLIITSASTDDATQKVLDNYDRYKYVFRDCTNITGFTHMRSQSIMELFNPKTYVFIGTDYKYSRDVFKQHDADFSKLGVKCLAEMYVSADVMDLTTEVAKIRELHPDVLINNLIGSHVLAFNEVWCTLKPDVPMFCDMSPYMNIAEQVTKLPDKGNYIVVEAQGWRTAYSPKSIPWWDAYKERWGRYPYGWGDQYSYDGFYLIKDAIERAGSLDYNKFIKAMEESDYVGTRGRYVFTEAHAVLVKPGYIEISAIQWWDGKAYVIWPDRIAERKLIPYWS